jgi:plasmid stability protein
VSTLIIRDLDDQLATRLKREAKKRDLSVNRLLHLIVERALEPAGKASRQNVAGAVRLPKRNDLGRFAGTWTQADYDEFVENTKHFSEIDPDMWK